MSNLVPRACPFAGMLWKRDCSVSHNVRNNFLLTSSYKIVTAKEVYKHSPILMTLEAIMLRNVFWNFTMEKSDSLYILPFNTTRTLLLLLSVQLYKCIVYVKTFLLTLTKLLVHNCITTFKAEMTLSRFIGVFCQDSK